MYPIYRLQELSSNNEENPDLSDIELIQHINVDTIRLIKLLNGNFQLNFYLSIILLLAKLYFYYFRNNIQK